MKLCLRITWLVWLALLEVKLQVQPVQSLLWTLGSKTDNTNTDYHNLLVLNKLALWW